MSNIERPKRGYTVLQNKVLRDERLSWKARGIFAYLWSQSASWSFYVTEVEKHAPDGKDSLLSGLRELEHYRYLTRKRVRDDQGHLRGTNWKIDDNPPEETPTEENPQEGNAPLRTTNSKNYQLKELPTEEQDHSPAKAARYPWTDVVDYLNEKTGGHYRHTDSNRRLIEPRLKEGFTLADCKQVIDNKVADWGGGEMATYLRPKTLFQASKFEGYLNEKQRVSAGGESYGGIDF